MEERLNIGYTDVKLFWYSENINHQNLKSDQI